MLPLVFETVNEFRNGPEGLISDGRNSITTVTMPQRLGARFMWPLGDSAANNSLPFG